MPTPFRNPKFVSTASELPGGNLYDAEEVAGLVSKLVQLPTHKVVTDIPATSTGEARQLALLSEAYKIAQEPTYKIATDLPTPTDYPVIPGMETYVNPVEQLQIPRLWDEAIPNSSMPTWKQPTYGFAEGLTKGFKRGFQYGVDNESFRSRSFITNRAPQAEYEYLPNSGRIAYAAGRIAADVVGHGSRQFIWRAHPEDVSGTHSASYVDAIGGNKVVATVAPYLTSLALGIGSGNYNPLNLTQGGRPDGFQAISPDEDDPRISTNPVYDQLVERGLFGRKGRLLPWEEFRQERPDVSYERYARYKDYLTNKDDNLLRKLSLGMAKGTTEGINGPELQIMGYSVTPTGAAAALGTLAATAYGVKRFAALRK